MRPRDAVASARALLGRPLRRPPGQGRRPARQDRSGARVHADDDRRAARLSLGDLRGKVVAVTFIYATCADTCPLLTAKMAGLQQRLGPDFGPKVRFVSDHRRSRARHAGSPQALCRGARGQSGGLGLPHGHAGRRSATSSAGTAIYAKKTERGDVDHTFLTSIIDQRGILRVQYLGVRFDPDEMPAATSGASCARRRPDDRAGSPGWSRRLPTRRSREAPRSPSWHRRPAHRGRRGRPPGAERRQPARRGPGQAPAEDRRLPPAPARHDEPALQRLLGPPRSRRPHPRGDAAPAQPVRLRPRPARSSSPRTRSSCSAACARTTSSSSRSSPRSIELIRAGKAAEGRELQLAAGRHRWPTASSG